MAGNREAFDKALRTATNFAWEGKWEKAIQAYQNALVEFPDHVDALTGLGMAYDNVGRPAEALDAYDRVADLKPEDPVLLERIAKAKQQLGLRKEAAKAFLASANQYAQREETTRQAVRCWEVAARLDPECVDARVSLLRYYQTKGRISDAVGECLALANIYDEKGRTDYAIRMCKHAIQIAPHSSEALAMLDTLRHRQVSSDDEESQQRDQTSPEEDRGSEGVTLPDAETLDFDASGTSENGAQKGSPVELTRRKALTDLAESVFEETTTRTDTLSKDAIDALISKAIDFQTRGKVQRAIAAYEKVLDAGAERPAVRFNLGLLYQEQLHFDDAIAQLEAAVSHPDYKLGSHFALGECYRARGRIDEALQHFIEVLKIVDLATVKREHADDLINLYEHLADGYLAKGDPDQALEFANSLVTFLSDQGWEDKVRVARQRLDTLTRGGPAVSLAEALTVPGSDRILEAIAMSQEYVKRGMLYTAMEECHLALGLASNYLPIHRQLAEVSRVMGKVDEAVKKLVVIADTYRVRGSARQGIAMYKQALKLAPMDTAVRANLIDLLVSHGEIDEALRHYLILADSYYHLAQMDQAYEVYQEALRLVPRVEQERDWRVRILHKIGDINMQRVDWRRAASVYEQIRDLAPGDERARLTLMELHYRLDDRRQMLEELDQLLELYREEGRTERVFTVLDDVVGRWPEMIPLRARLAQAHLNAGHKQKALEHLDRLGELQLNAGRKQEAKATIRAIIALRPPDTDDYKLLLKQIDADRSPES